MEDLSADSSQNSRENCSVILYAPFEGIQVAVSDLSPVTQAILDALGASQIDSTYRLAACGHAAATIRALARHRRPSWTGEGPFCHWTPSPHVRRELEIIADELEQIEKQ